MLDALFGRRTAERAGEPLYAAAAEQARSPHFYTTLGVADRIDARFELYTLHVLLLVLRLRDEPAPKGAEAAQALFDTYVSALDNVLRELGVGDISMARKMRNLGEALYGRMTTYEPLLRSEDRDGMAQALAKNVYEGAADHAEALTDYAFAARRTLAAQAFPDLLKAPAWPVASAAGVAA